jgi:hypothetical protein
LRRPQILVARAVFPQAVARLREHFEVETNADDTEWAPQQPARPTVPRWWAALSTSWLPH